MRGSIAIRAVLCGRYFFLSKQLIQNNSNMEVKQFIELYINSSDVEQINMLINMPTSGKMILIQQLIGEYRACQKKYEEKLRWIPVEEILPPKNKKVLVKYHNDNLFSTTEFESKDIIKTCNYCGITHWRFIL